MYAIQLGLAYGRGSSVRFTLGSGSAGTYSTSRFLQEDRIRIPASRRKKEKSDFFFIFN